MQVNIETRRKINYNDEYHCVFIKIMAHNIGILLHNLPSTLKTYTENMKTLQKRK